MKVRDPVLRKVKWLLARDPRAAAEMARAAELRGAVGRWTRDELLLVAQAYTDAAEALTARGEPSGRPARLSRAAEWLLAAAGVFERAGDAAAAAESLTDAGDLYLSLQDPARAEDVFAEAVRLAGEAGEAAIRADAIASLAAARLRRGDLDAAATTYEEARAAFEEVGDPTGQARALGALGELRLRAGDLDGALAHLERALAASEAAGDRRGQARALRTIGAVRHRHDEPEAARAALERALGLYGELWDRAGEAAAYQGLGTLALGAGDAGRAEALYREALASHALVGDLAGMAGDLDDLARAAWAAGQAARAALRLEAELETLRRLASPPPAQLVAVVRDQGEALLSIPGQAAAALACFRLAVADDRTRAVRDAIAARDPAEAARLEAELDADVEAVRRRGLEALLDDPALAIAYLEDQIVVAEAAEDARAFVAALGRQALELARAGRPEGAAAALAVAAQALDLLPEADRPAAIDGLAARRAEVDRVAGETAAITGDPEAIRAAAVETALAR